MKLSKILERLEYTCLQGTLDQEIEEVVADSRKAKEGSLFICIRGAVVDGHTFAKSVAEQGTKAIIVEEPVDVPEDVTVIQVKDSREISLYLREKATKTIRRSKERNIRWMNVC